VATAAEDRLSIRQRSLFYGCTP
jgi:hypothetical protein